MDYDRISDATREAIQKEKKYLFAVKASRANRRMKNDKDIM